LLWGFTTSRGLASAPTPSDWGRISIASYSRKLLYVMFLGLEQ